MGRNGPFFIEFRDQANGDALARLMDQTVRSIASSWDLATVAGSPKPEDTERIIVKCYARYQSSLFVLR